MYGEGKLPYREIHPWFSATLGQFENINSDFYIPLWNYFAYGILPGSYGVAILCNDLHATLNKAHPLLTLACIKDTVNWLINYAPFESHGSPEVVENWTKKTDYDRRDIMIKYRLRPSVIDILSGNAVP
jgi:hypothetical protein